MQEMVNEDQSGPFILGQTPSYADFITVGWFKFLLALGEDAFEKAMAIDAGFPKLYQACEEWLERDQH